jgi:hypothetical protein
MYRFPKEARIARAKRASFGIWHSRAVHLPLTTKQLEVYEAALCIGA